MKSILFTILGLFCVNVYSKYLDNLDRSFDNAEETIVNIFIPLSEPDYQKLVNLTQISEEQIKNTPKTTELPDFEVKVNATVRYGTKEEERTVKFKTGGSNARSNSKVGFNLKFEEKIFNRKSIRLRPDPNDVSYMREKLTSDILNRVGLPSIQATYARLYINNEYFGLYTFLDAVKPAMIKKVFKVEDDGDDMYLYQCKYDGMDFSIGSESSCIDAVNEEKGDMTQLEDFIQKVNSATSLEQFEEFLDVNLFLKSVIVEWLIGTYDHFVILGTNFDLYKRKSDNKWCMLLHDFDNTFGHKLSSKHFNLGNNQNEKAIDYHTLSFKDFNSKVNHKIFKYLIYDDDTKFKAILKDVLIYAFNPEILEQHISELKTFLIPYVIEDLTPINDQLPGRINKMGKDSDVTFSDFEENNEIQEYIQKRYDAVIKEYGFNSDEIIELSKTQKPTSYFTLASTEKQEKEAKDQLCWSRYIGYICCDKCNVLYVDEEGKWGIEDGYWCGINPSKCKYEDNQCVKNKNNDLPCCSTCDIYLTDATGRYGYKNGEWFNKQFNCP